jgi:16S rRNA processing protein RimM
MSRAYPETILVGKVVRAHGLRGEVVVEVLSDVEDRFADGAELLTTAGRSPLRVEQSRPHKGALLVRFRGLDDRTAAEGLRGSELLVHRDAVPAAPDGAFYYYELVDCRCVDRHEGDLGRVSKVVEDGGGLLLEVSDDRRRLLVPFVHDFLVSVDVESGRIEVDLPPGLVELCASK